MKIDIDLVELEQKFDEILAIENHIFVTVSELARKTRPPVCPPEPIHSLFGINYISGRHIWEL